MSSARRYFGNSFGGGGGPPAVQSFTSITVGAGSAAAPSIAIGEATTGFYSVAAGTLGLTVSGALIYSFTQQAITPYATNFVDLGSAGNRFRTVYVYTSISHLMGTSTGAATMVGVANINTTAVGNVGAGTDDLMTYAMPANAFSANGKGVRVTAWGSTANNANAKTITMNFGATAVLTNALTVSIAGAWRIEAEIFRTGASTQLYSSQLVTTGTAGVALNDVENGTAAITDTAAITIKCTGTATTDNDIIQNGLIVEFLN